MSSKKPSAYKEQQGQWRELSSSTGAEMARTVVLGYVQHQRPLAVKVVNCTINQNGSTKIIAAVLQFNP